MASGRRVQRLWFEKNGMRQSDVLTRKEKGREGGRGKRRGEVRREEKRRVEEEAKEQRVCEENEWSENATPGKRLIERQMQPETDQGRPTLFPDPGCERDDGCLDGVSQSDQISWALALHREVGRGPSSPILTHTRERKGSSRVLPACAEKQPSSCFISAVRPLLLRLLRTPQPLPRIQVAKALHKKKRERREANGIVNGPLPPQAHSLLLGLSSAEAACRSEPERMQHSRKSIARRFYFRVADQTQSGCMIAAAHI